MLLIIKSLNFESRTFVKEKRRSEIANDWTDVPFVDLIVTTDDTCPGDSDIVMTKPWLGTKLWCVCKLDAHYEEYEGECWRADKKDYRGECFLLEA